MLPARKIQYQPYEAYRQAQHDEKMKQASVLLKAKQERYQKRRRISLLLRSLFCSLVVVGIFSLLIARYALIFESNYDINNMKQTIRELELQKEELRVACDSATTLENVQLVASRDLGMQYPQPEQIVYLTSNWNYKLQGKYAGLDKPPSQDDILEGDVLSEVRRYATAVQFWLTNMD